MKRTREINVERYAFRSGETFTLFTKKHHALKGVAKVDDNYRTTFVCNDNVTVGLGDVQMAWVHEQVF